MMESDQAVWLIVDCGTGVLAALVLNTTFDWWWADPIAALLVAAVAFMEGTGHWRDAAPHDVRAAPD